MPFIQNFNDYGPRRRRTVRLEDISTKGQWDRTFYPKKNTLMSKASDLEICSGALVAVIVWAPTGEQFYYASRQVVKKNLIKSNLILPKAILEYQESLHMQPASIPKPATKLTPNSNKVTPKKPKKSLLFDADQVEDNIEVEKDNSNNECLKVDREIEATKMFNAHYLNCKSKPSDSDDVVLVSAPTAPRPPIARQSSNESSTEESSSEESSSEESSSEESSSEESSSEEDIEQEKAKLEAEIQMLKEKLPKEPASNLKTTTNQQPVNSSKNIVTRSKAAKDQKANTKQKILKPATKKQLKSKASPNKTSKTPATPSRTPAEPSRTPTTLQRTPDKPSRTPAEPSRPSSTPSRAPAEPSRAPRTPSRAPAEPSRAPRTPSRAPAEPSRPPDKPSRSSRTPTEPSRPSRTPVEPSRSSRTSSRTPSESSRTSRTPSESSRTSRTPVEPSRASRTSSRTPSEPSRPSRTPSEPSRPSRTQSEPSRTLEPTKEAFKEPHVGLKMKVKEEPVDLTDDVIIKSEPYSPPRPRSPPRRRSPSVVHLRLNSPTPSEMGNSTKQASKRRGDEVDVARKRSRIELSLSLAQKLKDRISNAFKRDYQLLSKEMKQLVDSLWQKISPTRHPLKIFIYRFKFLFPNDPLLIELINTYCDSNQLYKLLKKSLSASDMIDFEMFHHQISVITKHEIVKKSKVRSTQLKAKQEDESFKQFTRDFFHFCFSDQMYLSNYQLLDFLICNMSIEHITRLHKRIVCVPLQCLLYECGCFKSLLTSLQSRFATDHQIADYFRQINLNSSCYSVMFAPFRVTSSSSSSSSNLSTLKPLSQGSKILCFVIRDSRWVDQLVKISQNGIPQNEEVSHNQSTRSDFSSYDDLSHYAPTSSESRRHTTFSSNPAPWNRMSKKKKK